MAWGAVYHIIIKTMKTEQISYAELAKRVGDCVLFNNHNAHNECWYEAIYLQPLLEQVIDAENNENMEGLTEEERENYEYRTVLDTEIYQTYHITRGGAEYLLNHTSEMVSYDEALDAYLWHISHWGTSWSGVYTTFHDYSDESDHEYLDISNVPYAF